MKLFLILAWILGPNFATSYAGGGVGTRSPNCRHRAHETICRVDDSGMARPCILKGTC